MKRFILIGWILYLTYGCSDNDKANQHLAINERFPVSILKQDYEQLIRVVNKNHPALYDFVNKSEYESLMKLQYEQITDSLTVSGFYNILSPLVSGLGCGHSGLFTGLGMEGFYCNIFTSCYIFSKQ